MYYLQLAFKFRNDIHLQSILYYYINNGVDVYLIL